VVAVARTKRLVREEVGQLGRQAEDWALAGHPAGMLIADRSLAARAVAMLQAVADDTLLQPTWLMHDFVRRSISYAQQKRRRAWARRFTAIGAVLVIVFLFALAIPWAREDVRLNHALGPLGGDVRAESIYPDWLAVMASSVLQTRAAGSAGAGT
jgi:hypothetical protein